MRNSEKYLPKGISSRPGYTSGRGARTSDLNSDQLLYIYNEIKENEGYSAADNFVSMIENLKVASCTDFLLSLYRLEDNKWKFDNFESNGIYTENEGEAIGTLFATLSGNNIDDTLAIVVPFLNKFNKVHISDRFGEYSNKYNSYNMFYR